MSLLQWNLHQTQDCNCQPHFPGLAGDRHSVYRQLQRVCTRTEFWPFCRFSPNAKALELAGRPGSSRYKVSVEAEV